MKLFDLNKKRIGVLNDKAKAASWNEPPEAFREILEDAFEFESFEDYRRSSHRIHPVIPKPEPGFIKSALANYYSEQAHQYDFFDLKHESRLAYTRKINELIAEDFRVNHPTTKKLLALAVGTGRRAMDIREMSGLNYGISGVDLSEEMCTIASSRGIEMHHGDCLSVDLGQETFDAACFLYAFGHICRRSNRIQALQNVAKHLQPGAPLYFDVFNLEDKNEWGPSAMQYFEQQDLEVFGYDPGDVFYKKVGGEAVAFLHYFRSAEIEDLVKEAGLQTVWIKHIGYAHRSGQLLETDNEGSLFVKVVKPD
jgi:ubiquinone/menaquinone biosynthesis C-methylase UbiE